jgi:hypothetical protein
MIHPTIGRIVWYHPEASELSLNEPNDQVRAAMVAYVWSDRLVNLTVSTPNGNTYGMTSVVLIQDGDDFPTPKGRYCEWMPYQKSVAKGEIAPARHASGEQRS